MIELGFVIPGDIMLRTGGYIYDRHVMTTLPNFGIAARHVALPGSFPFPPEADLAETARILARIDADSWHGTSTENTTPATKWEADHAGY